MKKNKKGFTLAEVLITLTVIGVVAAITIPALMQSIDERAWKAQKKALHVRLTNAIMDMPKIKGFGEYKSEKVGDETVITDTAAETFLVDGLSKVYKMTNICGKNLESCGLPTQYTNLTGGKVDFPKTVGQLYGSNHSYNFSKAGIGASAFQTPNGESVAVYYNPYCVSIRENATPDFTYYVHDRVCVNFIYDLNGPKNPNQVGKDIGVITVVQRENLAVVSPNVYEKRSLGLAPLYSENGNDANALCKKENKNLRLPDVDEMISISLNKNILLGYNGGGLGWNGGANDGISATSWSSTVLSTGNEGYAKAVSIHQAIVRNVKKNANKYVYCVYE